MVVPDGITTLSIAEVTLPLKLPELALAADGELANTATGVPGGAIAFGGKDGADVPSVASRDTARLKCKIIKIKNIFGARQLCYAICNSK